MCCTKTASCKPIFRPSSIATAAISSEARYYLRENLDILIDSLLRGWSVHGASRELYLDNAKIYHAHALRRACCRLEHSAAASRRGGSASRRPDRTLLRHGPDAAGSRGPRRPAADAFAVEPGLHGLVGGRLPPAGQQRNRTATAGALRAGSLVHPPRGSRSRSSGTSCTANAAKSTASTPMCGSTRLYFRVDPQFRDDWVEVRYDPFTELETVLLYSEDGEYLGVGQRHQREGPVEQPAVRPPGPAQYSYLDLLIQKHEQILAQRSSGIDYPAALARGARRWPLLEFAKQVAAHLGRTGGLSAFRSDELETLQKIHAQLPQLDADLLEQAWLPRRATHASRNLVPVTETP